MGHSVHRLVFNPGSLLRGRSVVDLTISLVLFSVVLGIFAFDPAAAAEVARKVGGTDVVVEASNHDALRLSVEGLAPVWKSRTVERAGVDLFDVGFEGFVSSGEAGQPRLPRTGGWVLVPPGTRPVLKVVREQWVSAGDRPLMVEMVPVMIGGDTPGESSTSEILVLPGEDAPADADIPQHALESLARRGQASPGTAVTLGQVSWWRGRRIVSCQLTPVRHDASGHASEVLESGAWEIRFVPDPLAGADITPEHARKSSTRNDLRFGDIFLNRDLVGTLPTEGSHRGVDGSSFEVGAKAHLQSARGGKAGTLLGPESRLAVWKTGLVRVTYARLKSRGLLPDDPISKDQIRLYQRRYLQDLDDGSTQAPYVEIEVPIHMVGEGDNFDGDDFFVFYGLRLRDDGSFEVDLGNGPETINGSGDPWEMNNAANLYWLAASEAESGTPWLRMSASSLPASTGTPLKSYRRNDHIEEQLAFRENPPFTAADRVYYNPYRSYDVRAGINPLWAPDPAGAAVDLEIAISGWNTLQRDLRLELITNSSLTTQLEDFVLATTYEDTFRYQVSPDAIAGNFAEIRMYNPVIPKWVYAFLNWVNISYDALYQATNNKVEFTGSPIAGPQPIEVAGFTSGDIGLIEITDPRNPVFVELAGTNVTTADNTAWTLSILPDQSGGTRKFAAVGKFTTDGVDEFPSHLSSVANDPTNPTELAGPQPDLIVITHSSFRNALDRWIEHRINRAGGNLNVHVVDVEDLFDWYSGGLKDPWALKRFVTHTITSWNSWALTIVGDANENILEMGVLTTARDWAVDWVPTHYHVQSAAGFSRELMASDKWYTTLESGNNYPEDQFPLDVFSPWDMYTGRLPCNSVEELDRMIDKIMIVEKMESGQDWRRRGHFIADDAWSNGYGVDAYSTLLYKPIERVFAASERDSLARFWNSGSPVTLDSVVVLLDDYLGALPSAPSDRDLEETRAVTGASATPILTARLSEGSLVAHYQGHANPYVLTSEYWMEDRQTSSGRKDVSQIVNTDKPWFFMGLGCHVADWAQNTVLGGNAVHEPCLAEKFLSKSRAGASATYASSGYEYITENKVFGEYIFRRWMKNPPSARLVSNGESGRSRWVLGELMWAAEADIFAIKPGRIVKEMISQYVILGDPLMGLNAGEPVVTATLVGTPDKDISGEVEIFATDESNLRTVTIVAKDEAGIDRLEVTDAQGMDVPAVVITESLPEGATNYQEVHYSLQVPIDPYDHQLTVNIWDTGSPLDGDQHYQMLLVMPQTAAFSIDGSAIDPATFVFPAETPLGFSASVTSAAWLLGYNATTDFALDSETLQIENVDFQLDKNQHLTVNFTATSPTQNPDDEHGVVLTIDGFDTDLVLQAGTADAVTATIGKVYNFPNPMSESTRFVFESGVTTGSGTVRVFSVAGRPVARIPFSFAGGGSGVVDWNGRDNAGDEMGNGTYLYRVEIESNQGLVVSDMQRLVMMR